MHFCGTIISENIILVTLSVTATFLGDKTDRQTDLSIETGLLELAYKWGGKKKEF